ncbi:MAG: hypothetical protein P4L40_09800 [Terracidiphilus sp.]|nr:hypothetical protein [Terracidiphilus sp.]
MPVADRSFVLVYRKLTENPVWTQLSPAVLKVMIAFLFRANWKPSSWYDGRAQVEIPRGSFITSYAKMAQFCHLSIKEIRGSFEHLERAGFAAYTRASKWTMVTILNYDTYQDLRNEQGTMEGTMSGGMRAQSGATIEQIKNKTNTCSSDDEHVSAIPSIDEPPFETTEPGALFPVPTKQKTTDGLTPQQEQWFTSWWSEYWRRVSRKDARRAFGKHVKNAARFEQVVTATRAQRPGMLERPAEKRPHGATWLDAERWNDEPAPAQQSQSAAESTYTKWEPPVAVHNG